MQRALDLILFALERLWQHRVLVFWTLVGLSAATTLALSLTLYVDAVNTDLLTDNLPEPPYAFRFRYLGSWEGAIAPQDVQRAAEALRKDFARTVGLPVQSAAEYVSVGSWNVTRQGERPAALGVYTLGALEGADVRMVITGGAWPAAPQHEGAIPC